MAPIHPARGARPVRARRVFISTNQAIRPGLIALAVFTLASFAQAAVLKVEPGTWATTVTPLTGPTAHTPVMRSRCVTQEQIDGFANMVAQPTQHSPGEDCKRTSFHESTIAVEWKYECTGKFTITREGSIKFDRPAHYTGLITTKGTMMGKDVDDSSAIEGLRLGACSDKQGGEH